MRQRVQLNARRAGINWEEGNERPNIYPRIATIFQIVGLVGPVLEVLIFCGFLSLCAREAFHWMSPKEVTFSEMGLARNRAYIGKEKYFLLTFHTSTHCTEFAIKHQILLSIVD